MLFFFFASVFARAPVSRPLWSTYVAPSKNSLEAYPFHFTRLCIADPAPEFPYNRSTRCRGLVAWVSCEDPIPTTSWCRSRISNSTRSFLDFLLSKHYSLIFASGKQLASCRLGPTGSSVFSHLHFVFLRTQTAFSLHKVIPSDPVNITEPFISFSYETSFVSTPRVHQKRPILHHYLIGLFIVILLIHIAVMFPKLLTSPSYVLLSRLPSHSFILSILCGSGAGEIAFWAVFASLVASGVKIKSKVWLCTAVSECAGALATALVTSVLCTLWRVKDVASALYFAPLVFPALLLALVFSVQWILVGTESCASVPLHAILIFVAIVAFVKIPVNLLGSLLFASVFKARARSKKVSVIVKRIARNRRIFLSGANSLLFIIAFPIVHETVESLNMVTMTVELELTGMFCACWILMSITLGVNVLSVRFVRNDDWGVYAFVSSAGAPVVLWVVMNLWSGVVAGRRSTLHLSIYPVLSGIVCCALSLVSGCISLLSAVLWILLRGSVPKRMSTMNG
jgi:hypothetical protein